MDDLVEQEIQEIQKIRDSNFDLFWLEIRGFVYVCRRLP